MPKIPDGAAKNGAKPTAGDGQPTNPGPDPDGASKNLAGAPPPHAKTAQEPKADATERWGDLPIQVREVFTNEGGAEMPPQYRDWIDGYYKKLLQLK